MRNWMNFAFLILATTVILSGCSKLLEDTSKLESEVNITDIKQSYYESFEEYGSVQIYYKIKNTGNVNIDYYKVYFKVTCVDGSNYTEWTNGLDVNVGKELTDYTYVSTAEKQYQKIEIIDVELTHY
jgi:hypothetical protein